MSDPVLIFDFDGTIADTYHYIVSISNKLAPEFKFSEIDLSEVDALRDKTAKEVVQYLKVPVLKIPAILARGKKEFHKGISNIKPIAGLKDVLHQMKALGLRMGILSSNAAENIESFLENHSLKIFDFTQSTSKVWSKNTSLQRLIAKRGFDKDSVFYIGDESRDIAAARKSGVNSVAVSWGYNSARTLEAHNPDVLVATPEDLLDYCVSIAG